MHRPLVSVICVCYDHAPFVEAALESVLQQSYPNVELIVVDDASSDASREVIQSFLEKHSDIRFIANDKNLGNCKAFNEGWRQSKGEFLIDLAADDMLLPHRIEAGVNAFAQKSENFGVQFSDAFLIDESGGPLGKHSDNYPHATIPQGDIYINLIERYFISSPTMLIRREVMDRLKGYDESLHYEDFDFWMRSSREYEYFYLEEPLMRKRNVPGSMSARQFKRGSKQQQSTYQVCRKIGVLNSTNEERDALSRRLRYEFLQTVRKGDFALAWKYFALWRENRSMSYK